MSGSIVGLRGILAVLVFLFAGMVVTPAVQPLAQNATNVEGNSSQQEFWQKVRRGQTGNVSIPDTKAGQLIQSEGEEFRALRNGPVTVYGAQALIASILLLAVFFILRGRVRISHGPAGTRVERFNGIERFGHWLLAVSFIVLGLTGLNVLYGRYVLLPILGPDAFAFITYWGKYLHNHVAFAFMLGVVWVFVCWIKDNFPSRTDIRWFREGGGIIGSKHPPAKKFNAGQKIIFWLVFLAGVSISLTGISLLFPFQFPMFAKTFAFLNMFGFDLQTQLTPMQEMQYAQLWHTIVSVFMIVVIVAHIYIGSIGMEGAFDAMGSGEVDLNWAKEHHALWVEKLDREGTLHTVAEKATGETRAQPAE